MARKTAGGLVKLAAMGTGSCGAVTLGALSLLATLGPAGCGNSPPPVFADEARAIARDYQAWGRVDDEVRWAPWLCRMPLPGIARLSDSADTDTHGKKLYSLFAKNRADYPRGPNVGQVIVKQAFTAVRADGVTFDPAAADRAGTDHFYPYAEDGGVVYRTGDPAGLYIMFKVDPATPDTDAGWVYATLSARGDLTASGRIASCIGCHEKAPHDRLFGIDVVAYAPATK